MHITRPPQLFRPALFPNVNRPTFTPFLVSQLTVRNKVSKVYIKKKAAKKPRKKLKTKSSVNKRFFLTGSGKLRHRQQGRRHNAYVQSRNRVRRLKKWNYVEGKTRKNILRMLNCSR